MRDVLVPLVLTTRRAASMSNSRPVDGMRIPFGGPPQMRLKELVEDGIDVFQLEGEIDLHYAPVLRSLLQSKVQARCRALLMDLKGVSFIDSSGLAAVIEYFRDSGDCQGVLCLSGLNETLQTIFEIVRLDKVIPIFASREEAIAALKAGTVVPPAPSIFDRSAA